MYLKTQENIYVFPFPRKRTHAGIPLGNGNFGALVWGENSTLNITVSRNDFWDHRNGQYLRNNGISYRKIVDAYNAGDFAGVKKLYESCVEIKDFNKPSTLLPCGRFELKLKAGEKVASGALDIRHGRLDLILDSGSKLEMTLNMHTDVLDICDSDMTIETVTARPSWDFEVARNEMQERLMEEPFRINDKDTCGWVQACPSDRSLAAICRIRTGWLLICPMLGDSNSQALKNAEETLAEYDADQKKFRAENDEFWANYWNELPEISLPEKFLNDFTPFAFFKFACATNPNAFKPAPLQGPWIEEYKFPPWGGNYTINVNIEQIYTLAFSIGKYEFPGPLFKMLESDEFKKVMKENAKSMFGIEDGYMLSHSINDRGMQCQNGFSTHSALDHGVTAWMARLYWLYYKYTGDLEFLEKRAYPFMSRVLRVYEEMLEEYEGRLSLPFAPSPEYGVNAAIFGRNQEALQEGRDSSFQLAAIHMLTDALLEASEILGKKPRPVWRDIKERLPEYCLYDDCGENRIALWEGQDLSICHRHHSHLACIYPFDTLKNKIEMEETIIDNTINHWIEMGMGTWSEWCMPWAAIIQTRMGFSEAPELLLKIWEKLFINETLASVYLPKFRGITAHRMKDIPVPREKNEIMQIEGTMATATAVCEMLVHQYGDTVYLFRGIPGNWQDVSFKNIRLPGGFIISAEKKSGKTVSVRVKSTFGKKLKIKLGEQTEIFKFSENEEKELCRDPRD